MPIPLFVSATAVFFYFIFHWNILLMLSYKYRLSPVYHFSQGAIAPLEGLFFGWSIPSVLFALGISPFVWLLPLSRFIIFFIVFVMALTGFKSNKAVEAMSLAEAGGAISLEPEKDGNGAGSWRRRCQAVGAKHGLSPREMEVFELLAKGRNAEFIHNELMISIYTAKTHGYRIYRKLCVNSQQELIDLVDSCEL
jgi:DNA-binding CsgD family transcriptional regulator